MAPKETLIVNNLTTVSQLFGISINTAREWTRRGMPTRDDGSYDLVAIHRWYRDREKKRQQSPKPSQEVAALEKRKLQVDVESRETDLAKKLNQLVDRDEAKAKFYAMGTRVKHRLYSALHEVTVCVPSESRAMVIDDMRHALERILHEIADWEYETEQNEESESDD